LENKAFCCSNWRFSSVN